ncbi:type 1 glutamine amidotransferase domain-containing protein [Streptosporangium roseum]|uniref:ThiJ/PfpI n=1 Tax=Streptosporangium roseum (strain ATCC 12428 / DSM 43021 / JCM 3005 / KCTC 9067 / NCIMB 10171 / NRRL 2505 / NI 9100) TaxID=479432 RepID=D2B141_STRRD|nr:type 1 glutamine amidotransferase domain-containing protein [Streptosporangium roseum]ACZ83448.1 ThiJ/PfpI [Streptosporangium roseum DSM 43021]
MAATKKILVIVTNVGEYEKVGMRTGLWLGELTHFWDVAEQAGIPMDIASPLGGKIPLDPESLSHEVLAELGTEKRYRDRKFMDLLEDTKKISEVNLEDYDAIYLTGGHGVMFDFPQSRDLEDLMAGFYESDRIVSTVCHGGTGLLNVTLGNGDPLVKGKRVTGFSWPEEELADRADAVPYNLQEELQKLGADYRMADRPFEPYVVEDGRLITGQNPGSARGVAEAVVRRLTAVA